MSAGASSVNWRNMMAKVNEVHLEEFRVRLDPKDVHRLRERALAQSRGGRLVFWTDYLRAAVAAMAKQEMPR